MSTKKENSKNNKYAYNYENGNLSKVITYRNNLIEEIKKDKNLKNITEIQNFNYSSVTDNVFSNFVEISKKAEIRIYELIEL